MTSPAPAATSPERSARPLSRAVWFGARARNAARRGLLVAGIGGAAVVATLLVLVLLPRQVDRTRRALIDALPPSIDSVPLLHNDERLHREKDRLQDALAAAQRADSLLQLASITPSGIAAGGDSTPLNIPATLPREAPPDPDKIELTQRLARVRTSPLTENYRELVGSALLRSDTRARAALDSIEQVDRDREAYAALSGPDARYAALSAKLNALGQRLQRMAEALLTPSSTDTATSAPATSAFDSTAPHRPRRNPQLIHLLSDSLSQTTQLLEASARVISEARSHNQRLQVIRDAAGMNANMRIPPLAMLLAALVLGLTVGYTAAVIMELRRPRVADAVEAERLTRARVIVHAGATGDVSSMRARRRADRALPPALDPVGESFQILHLTLTGAGDVARRVSVLSDSPLLAATVATNLAATAARESRAVLLVDLDLRHRLVSTLLRVNEQRGISDILSGEADVIETLRDYPVGRDVYMTVLHGGRRPARASEERRAIITEDLLRVARRYDLAVSVIDESNRDMEQLLPTEDVILCARTGSTPNAWLLRAMKAARQRNHRVRAVLLWTADAPTA